MKRELAKKVNVPIRPKQQLPGEIIGDLMGAIRNAFYAGDERWFADQAFLRRRVVTLPPQRYKEILLEVFQEIKRHGQTESVKYWPGYLVHCMQQHFQACKPCVWRLHEGLNRGGKFTQPLSDRRFWVGYLRNLACVVFGTWLRSKSLISTLRHHNPT